MGLLIILYIIACVFFPPLLLAIPIYFLFVILAILWMGLCAIMDAITAPRKPKIEVKKPYDTSVWTK